MKSILLKFTPLSSFSCHPAWRVDSTDSNVFQGMIKWYDEHRLYHFHPAGGVTFGQARLRDVSQFLREATAEEWAAEERARVVSERIKEYVYE